MRPVIFLFLACAMQSGNAAPLEPAAQKAPWFSGLRSLRLSMSAIRGLGESLADRPGMDAADLQGIGKTLQNLEAVKAAAGNRIPNP